MFKYIKNKKGNILTIELVIMLIILTFFIFYPFALYSSYQQRNFLNEEKNKILQLVATDGIVDGKNIDIYKTIIKNDFDNMGMLPESGDLPIIVNIASQQEKIVDGKNTLVDKDRTILYIDSSNTIPSIVGMSQVCRPNSSSSIGADNLIKVEIYYPENSFLNSTLGLIGKKIQNSKNPYYDVTNPLHTANIPKGKKVNWAYCSSGYIMSEYLK